MDGIIVLAGNSVKMKIDFFLHYDGLPTERILHLLLRSRLQLTELSPERMMLDRRSLFLIMFLLTSFLEIIPFISFPFSAEIFSNGTVTNKVYIGT